MASKSELGAILVTGGSGFVGNCVIRRLLQDGATVHVVLRPSAKMWRVAGIKDHLQIHYSDISDADAVEGVLKRVRPAVVLHLAAFGAYESQASGPEILRTNIFGTYNLLTASRAAGTRLFVSTGSSSEYGYSDEPMRETARLEPNSFYAVSKAAQTHLCNLVGKSEGMSVVTFRLFSVFGPWEEPTRLMPTLIRRARAGLPLEMVAANTARDFIYVDDITEALLDFEVLGKFSGEVFNLGTGTQSTLVDVVDVVQQIVGNRSEVQWGAMTPRRWDSVRWEADVTKAKQNLGWTARVSLREGVEKMASWMQEIGDDYGGN